MIIMYYYKAIQPKYSYTLSYRLSYIQFKARKMDEYIQEINGWPMFTFFVAPPMSTGKVTPIVPPSAQPLRELSPAHQRDQRDPLLRRYSARVRSLGADPKGACLEMGDMIWYELIWPIVVAIYIIYDIYNIWYIYIIYDIYIYVAIRWKMMIKHLRCYSSPAFSGNCWPRSIARSQGSDSYGCESILDKWQNHIFLWWATACFLCFEKTFS